MSEPRPRRKLGPFDATMMVMGGILGVGIFFTPAQVAELVPNETAFIVMWLIGGLVGLCGAFTFAELGGTFPRAGGWYVYLRESTGPLVSFLFAWVVLLVISTGALAVMAGLCATWLNALLPWIGEEGTVSNQLFATGLIIAISSLALGGVKVGATFQNACMLIKLGAVAALLVAGFLLVDAAPPAAELVERAAPAVEARPLWKGMVAAILPVLFSVGGWQMLGYAASEVRDAQRTIPRAVLVGVGGVILVYLLLNLDYLRLLGIEGLAGDFGFANRVASISFGEGGGKLLSLALAISAIGIITVNVIASPWVYVAMAREGEFFKSFANLHARTGAPVLALCLQCALAVMYVWAGDLKQLVNSVVFVEWIFHGLVAFGLMRLRFRRPDLPRPFRSLAYPLFPALYLIAATGVVFGALYTAEPKDTYIGLIVVVLGFGAYFAWRQVKRTLAR